MASQHLHCVHVDLIEVGRSSRSTLIATKFSLSTRAIASFSKLSCSITWHQWQAEYPIDRKIGRFSRRARSIASSPHEYQSTGLSRCCKRYGLVSLARRLDIRIHLADGVI